MGVRNIDQSYFLSAGHACALQSPYIAITGHSPTYMHTLAHLTTSQFSKGGLLWYRLYFEEVRWTNYTNSRILFIQGNMLSTTHTGMLFHWNCYVALVQMHFQ